MTPEQDALIKKAVVEAKLQESIDEMLQTGQFRQYVKQAKLGLILGEAGSEMDALLKLGYLKGYEGSPF